MFKIFVNNKQPIGMKFELFTVEKSSPSRMPTVISFLQARLLFTLCEFFCN